MTRRAIYVSCIGVAILVLPGWAAAEYYYGDFEEVPVERLLENLERRLEENPGNAHAHYLLARVHTMAFSSAPDSLRTDPQTGEPRLDDGASGIFIPPQAAPLTGETSEERRAHLEEAIQHYRRALALEPEHLPAQVGLGWSLMKAGQREEAVTILRPAFERAWDEENNALGMEIGRSLTLELGGYLMQLLDPEDDGREIRQVHRRMRVIEAKPKWVTPIIIPLGQRTDFASLTSLESAVEFDLDGSEAPRRWQWITPDAGWLVHDPLGRGEITSGRQLIGGVTFWIFWNDGYEALRALDDDADGELQGAELRGLAIWRDANADGVSDPGEVRPLADWGIAALSCDSKFVNETLRMNEEGVRFADGRVSPSYDWIPMGVPLRESN